VAALGLWSAPPRSSAPAPTPVHAAAPVAASPAVRPELAPAISLSYRVEHLKTAFRSGGPLERQAAIQEVEVLRRTYSTLDVLPLVEAMAIFARKLGDQHEPELGLEVINTVDRWAPGNATLLGTRVMLLRQEGVMGSLLSMADVLELTRLRLSHPLHRWLWLVQHIACLRLLATLMLWGWAITMVLRYRRVFRYLWEEPLGRKGIHPRVSAVLGAFLVTLPVILGLDPSLVAMVWLVMLAPFLLATEVRVTVLIIALQLLHPGLALLEPMAARHPESSIVTLQTRPQPVNKDPQIFARLNADDRRFLEAWRLLQFQHWTEAEAAFAGLAKTHPDQTEVMNNLGVAQFQQGNLLGAQDSFNAAFQISPRRVEVLLNQSVVAYKQLDSAIGSAKQEEARGVSAEDFTRLLAANQTGTDQRTFALPLPDSPERILALSDLGATGGRMAPPAVKDYAFLFNLVMPVLALGLFLFRLRRSINESHPAQCSRCGDPFHTTDSADPFVCSRCHHLFVLKDGLHNESRKKKVEGVATFQKSQRWIHRTLMVVLPGTDRCFIGDTSAGFLELMFLCLALGIVLATGHSVRYPGEILADPASVWLPMGLILLAVLFLRSWLKLLPRRY
jgi:tetratricopeptide (TPR) repeat protein/DNA-directed RNA polymerase subunit RPC12/RpoP